MIARARFYTIRNNIIPFLLTYGIAGGLCAAAAALAWLACRRMA